MYQQFADTQMMPGVPQVPQRPPYPGYYGQKVPEESPYVGIGVPPRPAMGYGGKPGMMVGPESMYGHGWNANMHPESYMGGKGLPGKPDYHYQMQAADMYRQHMVGGSGYPDPQSMQGGYPGMPGYPSHPYPSYPPYHSQHHSAMAMGGMPGGGPSAHGMDGYADGLASGRGQPAMGYHPSQVDAQWRRMAMSGRQWAPDMMTGMDGYPGPGHSESRGVPPPSSSASTSTPSHPFSSQQQQQSQQQATMAAASPQPNTGPSSELQKQSSVSSIKEALLAATPGTVPSRSPFNDSGQQQQSQPTPPAHRSTYPLSTSRLTPDLRDQLNQSSPLTPQAAVAKTPDPLTPRGAAVGGVASPSLNPPPFPDHQGGSPGVTPSDTQALTRQNSTLEHDPTRNNIDEGKQNLRVSPFQMEKLLEGKGRKERQQFNAADADSGFKPNSFKSPVQERADKGEAVSNLPGTGSPYSPRLRPSKGRKTPVLSPVTRDHQSLVNQYNLSDEPGRREFLDALFNHHENAALTLLRVPTVCKAQLDLYRVFTTVQKLGGFSHVVDKRLWKEVVKSFSNNASNPTSSALRTLQDYYVKMLLPYECHLSNIDLKQCLAQYENLRRVSLDSLSPASLPDKSERLSQTAADGKTKQAGMDDDSGKSSDLLAERMEHGRLSQRVTSNGSDSNSSSLHPNSQLGFDSQHSDNSQLSLLDQNSRSGPLPFSEDSQGSLDSISSQRLPDISVQDAESILGITSGIPGGQGTPSPSYPPYQQGASQEWPAEYTADYGMDISVGRGRAGTPGTSGESASGARRGEIGGMMAGSYPPMDMAPGGGGGYPGSSTHRYSSFRRGSDYMHMPGSYMSGVQWAPGMEMPGGSLSHSMEAGGAYAPPFPGGSGSMMGPHSSVMRPTRMDDMAYPMGQGSSSSMMDWQWSQQQSQQSHNQIPRLPAPLPPHLQPLMFQHSSPQPRLTSSPQPPTTPQQLGSTSSSPHDRQSSPHPPSSVHGGSLDPVRIQWQESEIGAVGPPNRVAGTPHKPEMKEPKKVEKSHEAPEPKPTTHQTRMETTRKRVSMVDWSNCVEGTKPQLIKRRRLTCDQCGHVEPWRVMMSLKSGLPSDSTWALDTLNILLHDDRTVGFFYLKHHHSLLNTLVDHLRKYLSLIFIKEFEILPQYQPGYEGQDARLTGLLKGEEGDLTTEWLLEASLTCDSDIVQSLMGTNGRMKREESSDDSASGKSSSIVNGDTNGSSKGHLQNGSGVVNPIPFAPLYSIAEDNTRFNNRDPNSHILTSCPHTDENFSEEDPVNHPMKSYLEKISLLPEGKFQKVDETPLTELMKREALTERMLIDLRTPKRLMARSPIQKYFLPSSTKSFSNSSSDDKREDALSPSSEESVSSPLLSQEKNRLLQEEDEVFKQEMLPLWSKSSRRNYVQMRCLCISNILRSLSFIPGNDIEFSQHRGILVILGRILMLHHNHFLREQDKHPLAIYRQEGSLDDAPPPPVKKDFWWWDCLEILRENTFVILANIAGQLDLSVYPEAINYPIITGLLHWLVCPSSQAIDPLPDAAMVFSLSPQRLVVEALAKMSISEMNVDYILATPPLTRLDMVYQYLVQFICQKKYPAVRQFALVILSNFAQGGEAASRMIGQQKMVIPLLIECLESSEQTIVSTKGRYPGGYNPDDPNSLSVAMLRRAAITLHCLTKVPITRVSFLPFRDRLLHLSTLEFLDPSVSTILTDVLFELGKL